jgi:predicted ATPase
VTTFDCLCPESFHDPQFVVLTGGPGAGKTAVLEVVNRSFCQHVAVLPEAASIVFGGGFPRRDTAAMRRAAQCAIFHIQRELEDGAREERSAGVVLCDRGLIDGLAYWPDDPEIFWRRVGMTLEEALSRYAAVIHLATPAESSGYDHRNPLRIETASQALALDARIRDVWARHPRRVVVESRASFVDKLTETIALIRKELPPCCANHRLIAA